MNIKLFACTLALFSFFCSMRATRAAETPAFWLKNGDTVVFYGDSITEQTLYDQWVELYTVTRFPKMRVHFYGAGVGGDRVTGGGGGTIDERLARDVFPHKPTVITVMLGMNDGSYRANAEDVESVYTKGFEHLLESVEEHAPGARITLIGPSPFDDVTRPARFPGGYNGVMQHYAELDAHLAEKYHGSFVNFNPPVVALLARAQAYDPQIAQLILPDRVHPEVIAHWVMAESLLKGWNAPALVSSVTLDADRLKLTDSQNATVEAVARENGGLHWSETEGSLPLPFDRGNAMQALLLQLTDIDQQLNQETLRITNLEAGQYMLKIDDQIVGTFPSEALSTGINLADCATPMRSQAQRVSWMVRDRDQAHTLHLRMLIRKENVGSPQGSMDVMDQFENSLENSIYEEAAPKAHAYSLVRVEAPASPMQ
ncbi:MAG: SGNH/GDSL hydrolase family protein [Terracidiphilus sp.]